MKPQTVTHLHSFLGFTNYYGYFINLYESLSILLEKLFENGDKQYRMNLDIKVTARAKEEKKTNTPSTRQVIKKRIQRNSCISLRSSEIKVNSESVRLIAKNVLGLRAFKLQKGQG